MSDGPVTRSLRKNQMKLTKKLLRQVLGIENNSDIRETSRGGMEHDGKHYYAAASARSESETLVHCDSKVNVWREA